jgi:hypothetical protein
LLEILKIKQQLIRKGKKNTKKALDVLESHPSSLFQVPPALSGEEFQTRLTLLLDGTSARIARESIECYHSFDRIQRDLMLGIDEKYPEQDS